MSWSCFLVKLHSWIYYLTEKYSVRIFLCELFKNDVSAWLHLQKGNCKCPPFWGVFSGIRFLILITECQICISEETVAVVWRCFVKMVFVEISQNSQENTCARISFLIKLQLIKKEILAQVFSCEFCEILRTPFLQNTSSGCF